jgi:hypothetical protein
MIAEQSHTHLRSDNAFRMIFGTSGRKSGTSGRKSGTSGHKSGASGHKSGTSGFCLYKSPVWLNNKKTNNFQVKH